MTQNSRSIRKRPVSQTDLPTAQSKKQWKREILQDIKMQKLFVKCFPVFSNEWCDSMNRLEYDYYILDEMNREGEKLFD